MERAARIIRAGVFAACLWAASYFAGTGLQAGAVESFWAGERIAHRASHPAAFWVSESVWFLLACFCLLALLDAVWPRNPFWQKRLHAVAARRHQAQVRRIEAGQVLEPPWVRYSPDLSAAPESEISDYLTRIFAPYWLSLGLEARAAYLQRYPPDTHWRKSLMELSNLPGTRRAD